MSPAVAVPRKPALTCADCGSRLVLREKPAEWGPGLVYLCERRPACRGLMSAHPDGEPCGVPATQEIRTARRHVHAVLDPLWQLAPRMYEIREPDPQGQARAAQRIRRTARVRAYQYIAAQIGTPDVELHISQVSDIETLRAIYRAAKKATPELVREWAKAQKREREA